MILRAWARDGLTNEQIAKNCGITPSTLYKWKKDHSEISEALSRGKVPVDIEVENALHKLAVGYNAEVKKTFKVRRVEYNLRGQKAREYEELVVGIDEVHVPPNVNAQKLWLVNRKPDQWREKVPAAVPTETADNMLTYADIFARTVPRRALDDAESGEAPQEGGE